MNINNISNLNPLEQKSSKNDNLLDQSFSDILTKTLGELNDVQQKADKAVADLATGEVKDLHQAAIAIGKAETSMKLMLEVRNKAISAYKEIA
ncbi:MAG: flagellar hook-basal body complex protein FliE, partial [Campylobacter sp.]|nr:flagellar hook-basal body complex protein FliE [Campylobacter sp.]